MPERIQRKRTKGWRKPTGAVNVTRGSDWGNPFKVGARLHYEHDVDGAVYFRDVGPVTPRMAIVLFQEWVEQIGAQDQIRRELGGKDLMCFCPLDQPCHADFLLMIANRESP